MVDGINRPEIFFNNDKLIEIKKSLDLLYMTLEGSIPLDRKFGLNHDCIDMPPDVAENLLSIEIIEKTEAYFDNIEVSNIEFKKGVNGRITPCIYLSEAETEGREE